MINKRFGCTLDTVNVHVNRQ